MSDNYNDFDSHKGFNQKHKKKDFKKKRQDKINEKNNVITEEIEGNDNGSQLDEENEEVEEVEEINKSPPRSKFLNGDSEDSDSESEQEDDILMKNKKKKQRKGKGKNRNRDTDSSNLTSPSTSNTNTNIQPSTPSFIGGGDVGFGGFGEFGGLEDESNAVKSPEKRINELFENKIHIHKILRPNKANKFDVVLSNLNMVDVEIGKALLKKIKVGCGFGGSIKENKDANGKNYVISINSNDPERIVTFLVEKCNINEDMIISHT